jgi:hypothetical protein
MWTCPRCERQFKTKNQSHSCVNTTIDELFANRPDNLILAFDQVLSKVIDWEPTTVGTSKNTIIFTNKKAWLIIKPMTRELDIKFYYHEPLQSAIIKKTNSWGKKFAHHIRIQDEHQVNSELLTLLRKGFDFAME